MEIPGIKPPAFKNKFMVKFVNAKTGSELENLSIQIVRAVDGAGEVSMTVELDCKLLALKDIAKLKADAKDYVMLICVMDLGSDIGGALAYENIKVVSDPLNGMTWDYAEVGTQNMEITVRYETRRVLTPELMGPLQQILKTPA